MRWLVIDTHRLAFLSQPQPRTGGIDESVEWERNVMPLPLPGIIVPEERIMRMKVFE